MTSTMTRFRRPIATTAAAAIISFSYYSYNQNEEETSTKSGFMAGILSSGFHSLTTSTTVCEKPTSTLSPKVVFLGTGSSTGCPKPICIMQNEISKTDKCKVSRLAVAADNADPTFNKNYRNNPSLLIHTQHGKNIVIDVGKTFREGALRWLPHLGVNTTLDAIVLTHHHMDAAAGLDDLRGFQGIQYVGKEWSRIPIPVYLSEFCHGQLQSQFPWLLPKQSPPQESSSSTTTTTTPVVKRDVASLQANIFQDYQPIRLVDGVTITPLPIWHGDDLISHGFAISIATGLSSQPSLNIVYLSDISRMVPETWEYIQTQLPPTDIFICDALLWHNPHPVHYSLQQAMELYSKFEKKPKEVYFVGMNCDNFLPHDEMNAWLKEEYKESKVRLAHDGLVIEAAKVLAADQ